MDKEKEIQEMTREIHQSSHEMHQSCCISCPCSFEEICDEYNTAKRLYNAGYRKADDVRKETVREILEVLKNNNVIGVMPLTYELREGIKSAVNQIIEKYGVEVDE